MRLKLSFHKFHADVDFSGTRRLQWQPSLEGLVWLNVRPQVKDNTSNVNVLKRVMILDLDINQSLTASNIDLEVFIP
jgi:hypothetical protein